MQRRTQFELLLSAALAAAACGDNAADIPVAHDAAGDPNPDAGLPPGTVILDERFDEPGPWILGSDPSCMENCPSSDVRDGLLRFNLGGTPSVEAVASVALDPSLFAGTAERLVMRLDDVTARGEIFRFSVIFDYAGIDGTVLLLGEAGNLAGSLELIVETDRVSIRGDGLSLDYDASAVFFDRGTPDVSTSIRVTFRDIDDLLASGSASLGGIHLEVW